MASMYLYPPILDSSMPVFNKNDACNIYYSLSKFNSVEDIKSIQISVMYQKSGTNAVKKTSNTERQRFRDTGIIILNEVPIPVPGKSNLYMISILPEDMSGGWFADKIYKVQLRFSSVVYYQDDEKTQEEWLNDNENYFSEWSTVSAIKPIEKIRIQIPIFGFDNFDSNTVNETTELMLYSTTLDFHGTYYASTQNENLYSYRVILYDEGNDIVEDSKVLFVNKYYNSNQFKYLFSTELTSGSRYRLSFSYKTEHGFEETFDDFNFIISASAGNEIPFKIYSVDNAPNSVFPKNHEYSVYKEEEEARIGLKLFDVNNTIYNGNICIRRTDSKSNFTKWEDIKIINFIQETINSKDIFYDYTIESGIWYKYAIQEISKNALDELVRGQMSGAWEQPIIRNFEYSYLLGENGVQLKLKYNNDMTNFKINVSDGRVETIGGQFPFITRNGNTKYKTFPVNALISFNMDDVSTFINEQNTYNLNSDIGNLAKEQIVKYYKNYNQTHFIDPNYDYTREFFFREKVLEFLHDGKPKLFKSATEGNIIIRLMDINTSPIQSLNRMLYSFSATAYEMAEANLENYMKYKFCDNGFINTDFSIREVKLGQIIGDFTFGENIFDRIWDKYDSKNKNIAGYSIRVENIRNLEIEINSKPFVIKNNANEYALGNNINYGDVNNHNNQITIYHNKRRYTFDTLLTFTKNNFISFLGFDSEYPEYNADGQPKNSVNATINFTYDFVKRPYVAKKIKSQSIATGIGQYYESTEANTSIYGLIYNKYYKNWNLSFTKLSNLHSVDIEASPRTVLLIRDSNDSKTTEYLHEVGVTGVLNLNNLANIKEITFLGMRQDDGSIKDKEYVKTIINDKGEKEDIYKTISTDILINYTYILTKGEYMLDES